MAIEAILTNKEKGLHITGIPVSRDASVRGVSADLTLPTIVLLHVFLSSSY